MACRGADDARHLHRGIWRWARRAGPDGRSLFRDLPRYLGAVQGLRGLLRLGHVTISSKLQWAVAALRSRRPEAVVCRWVRPWNVPLAGCRDLDLWPDLHGVARELAARHSPRGIPGRVPGW